LLFSFFHCPKKEEENGVEERKTIKNPIINYDE